jgi:hypothetical protein
MRSEMGGFETRPYISEIYFAFYAFFAAKFFFSSVAALPR